jgi:hypothetical protein
MAIGWLNALRVVPWRSVIDAAPGLAQSARGFFKRTQDAVLDADEAAPSTLPFDDADGDGAAAALAVLDRRIAAVEAGLAHTTERQHTTAQLLDSLASQNARLVEVVATLQKRCRWLLVAVGIALAGLVGFLVWALVRFG